MIKVRICLILLFFLQASCYSDELPEDVYGYIELLIRTSEPTLAEYSKYAGECGGESELLFVQDECKRRYKDIFSCECVKFSRNRCENAKNTTSLELGWVRKQFATAGKKYDIVNVERYSEIYNEEDKNITRNYKMISVKIGDNIFKLYRTENYDAPPGLSLYISQINDKPPYSPIFKMNEHERTKWHDFIYNIDEVCKF